VTLEPRAGNPAPRVVEFAGGMLNSIGLANPGLAATRRDKLPWLRSNVRRARVLVSIAGHSPEEYVALVEGFDGEDGFLGFEVNLSCPNDARRGGPPFALDPEAVAQVLSACRARTQRPLLAKLAPNDPALETTVRIATDAGADGLTLVNTLPGILLRPDGTPELGAGQGGMSGLGLRPAGLLAVRKARSATHLPLVGLGGVGSGSDAVAYARLGASLVAIGTASFAEPRAGERIVAELGAWGRASGIARWDDLAPPSPVASAGRAQVPAAVR